MPWRNLVIVLGASAIAVFLMLLTPLAGLAHKNASSPQDDAAAVAFQSMTRVLRHPRCMNCHSTGDFPRQGDGEHRHTMSVRRGLDGHGIAAVKCSTCHQ